MFRAHGTVYHDVRSLDVPNAERPRYAQIYFHDPANEISNRQHGAGRFGTSLHTDILEIIQATLDEVNPYVQSFRMMRSRYQADRTQELSMRLIYDASTDSRQYNAPTAQEVAAIVVGAEIADRGRDVLLLPTGGSFTRISDMHPAYQSLHYVLLFPRGEKGWHPEV